MKQLKKNIYKQKEMEKFDKKNNGMYLITASRPGRAKKSE